MKVETTKGNIWKSFNLNGENIKYSSIDLIDKPLTDATDKGEVLVKAQIQRAVYKFYKKDGEEYLGKVFKLYEGEIAEKTTLTKEVCKEDIKEVELNRAYDLFYEHEYIVSLSPSFAKQLKDKAIQFPFNTGFGFKPQIAILFFDNITQAFIMRTGRALRSKIIETIFDNQTIKQTAKKQLAELEVRPKGKKLKVEDF